MPGGGYVPSQESDEEESTEETSSLALEETSQDDPINASDLKAVEMNFQSPLAAESLDWSKVFLSQIPREVPKVMVDTIVKGSSSSPHHLSVTPKNKRKRANKYALVNNVIVLPKNGEALEELKKAQRKSVRQETLPDGRIVFYMHERPARNPDKTISVGHTYITKYDPKTGEVISWDEGHDSSGKVTRFRPKMVNSMHVTVPHYPPVYTDLQNSEFATDVKKFETVEGVRELLSQWQDIPQLEEFLKNKLASLEKRLFQHKKLRKRYHSEWIRGGQKRAL